MTSLSPALMFELRLMPQRGRAVREVELVVDGVVPLDEPEHAGRAQVAPVHGVFVGRGDIGHREPALDAIQLDTVLVQALVAARAGPLEGQRQAVRSLDRHPAKLHVTEEHHAGRSPVLDRVREHVGIHERAPRLSRTELAELAIGVTQAERRLSLIDTGAEELELEGRLEVAERRRRRGSDAEAALPHAGERAVVCGRTRSRTTAVV